MSFIARIARTWRGILTIPAPATRPHGAELARIERDIAATAYARAAAAAAAGLRLGEADQAAALRQAERAALRRLAELEALRLGLAATFATGEPH